MDYTEIYYKNNAKKLHKLVDQILKKFGGISQKDMDDFYSLANEVFVDVLKRYDREQKFEAFLYSCLYKKIMTEITRRNRQKRKADRIACSIDQTICVTEGKDISLVEMIQDNKTLENDIFEQMYSDNIAAYMEKLSTTQQAVLRLLVYQYKPNEILNQLKITRKEYVNCLQVIKSYENIRILM
ncbi:hypothetical protein H8S37_04265 [Mediterraneibacter sp. NSJ-55]|uniref:Sigma-70 family RNA polymerase sigma factor n=1 Tax=Mediterraneibacter hominis TaxID=2763054 RepID=A0A923LH05_9FIRM|nr:sigma factor [Mediterraneibacter hominis]MBC5688148.1 hypothetical protein [Mediterraneibacter hominis]